MVSNPEYRFIVLGGIGQMSFGTNIAGLSKRVGVGIANFFWYSSTWLTDILELMDHNNSTKGIFVMSTAIIFQHHYRLRA
jgi:hypothetical protein